VTEVQLSRLLGRRAPQAPLREIVYKDHNFRTILSGLGCKSSDSKDYEVRSGLWTHALVIRSALPVGAEGE
jgi:hypothetical protein